MLFGEYFGGRHYSRLVSGFRAGEHKRRRDRRFQQQYRDVSGAAPAPEKKTEVPAPAPAPAAGSDEQLQNAIDALDKLIRPMVENADKETKVAIAKKIKDIVGVTNFKKVTDIEKLRELYRAFKNEQE